MGSKFKVPVYQRLWQMFRHGSIIYSEIKPSFDRKDEVSSYGYDFGGGRDVLNVYSYFGLIDQYGNDSESIRNSRYNEYNQMEQVGEIHTALNIVADEVTSRAEDGCIIRIDTSNSALKKVLEVLFYDIIDVNFYLWSWVRSTCKYGDTPLYMDIGANNEGIKRIINIPVDDFQRLDGTQQDPYELRFKWKSRNLDLENWQVAHFRLFGQDKFLPYGTSYLEGARSMWRKLILMEDAMLVYRVIRAPERKAFYIDVSGIKPDDVEKFVQKARDKLRNQNVINKLGSIDKRMDPLDVSEDYFIPVRGERQHKIETLPGGQHINDIEDVEYLRKKLIASLGIPRAYLTYEEDLANKSTLASLDIRFSRTIDRIQRSFINELTKMALVHLIAMGSFDKKDLFNFEIKLANPSSMASMQKLELLERKVQVAAGLHDEKLFDRRHLYREFFNLNEQEIDRIVVGRMKDARIDGTVDYIREQSSQGTSGGEEEGGGGGGGGMFGGGGMDIEAPDMGEEKGGEEVGESELEIPSGEPPSPEPETITASLDAYDKIKDKKSKLSYRQNRERSKKRQKSGMVDIYKLVSNDGDDTINDPYGKATLGRIVKGFKTEFVNNIGRHKILNEMTQWNKLAEIDELAEIDINDDDLDESIEIGDDN